MIKMYTGTNFNYFSIIHPNNNANTALTFLQTIKIPNKSMKKIYVLLIAMITLAVNSFGQASAYTYVATTGATLETIGSPTVLTTCVGGTTDDDYNVVAPAGFTFPSFGGNYTQFTVVTNGWVRLGNFINTNIPTSLTSVGSVNGIHVFGRDGNMNVANGGNLTHGTAAGGKYVLQYTKLSGGGSGGASATIFATIQIVLWGSTSASPGVIEIIYGTSAGAPATAGTIGIVDAANTFVNGVNGSTTLTTTATTWPVSGQKYTFTPPPH
jgi:hypothetical protein